MKSKIIKRVLFFSLLYVFVGTILFINQRKFLYFPTGNVLHKYDQASFVNENERIEVIVLNDGQNRALLYFGGNSEQVVYNAPDFLKIFPQHTVYLFNYRGYGSSTGQPSEQGIYSDVLYLFDMAKKKHASISVIGRSLGSGVATFLAAQRPVEKLALVSPYDSLESIAQDSFFIYPMSLLLKDKYESMNNVKHIEAKTLAIIAEHDKVIPNRYSDRLIREFPQDQISVKTIQGVGHNTISDTREYYDLLSGFFEE